MKEQKPIRTTMKNATAPIAVIGGGIGGLLAARELVKHGYRVTLFEEHRTLGEPRHCTGLVSQFTVELIGHSARESTVGKFNSYYVSTCDPRETIELVFDKPIYLLDRVKLEKEIGAEVLSLGAGLNLGIHIHDVKCEGVIRVGHNIQRYEYIILAEGAIRALSTKLGMCLERPSSLIGLQAYVKMSGLYLDNPLIIACNKLSEEFFSWIVPNESNNNYIVGVATKFNVWISFMKLIKLIEKAFNVHADTLRYFGGLIPINRPCNPVKGRVLGIGDSISSTKPLTGGGLYPIALEIEALVKSLKRSNIILDVNTYRKELTNLLNMLSLHHTLRKLILSFGGYEGIVRFISSLGIRRVFISDYDRLKVNIIKMFRGLAS